MVPGFSATSSLYRSVASYRGRADSGTTTEVVLPQLTPCQVACRADAAELYYDCIIECGGGNSICAHRCTEARSVYIANCDKLCATSCTAGQTNCGGKCVSCPVGGHCLGTFCTCPSGQVNCGGKCVSCVGGSCVNGSCTCPPGTMNCGGQCLSTQCPPNQHWDTNSCQCLCSAPLCNGTCCPSGQTCSNGTCCPSGEVNCGGTCLTADQCCNNQPLKAGAGESCCSDGPCAAGKSCLPPEGKCGCTVTCPDNHTCCGQNCCASGQVCSDGATGTCVTCHPEDHTYCRVIDTLGRHTGFCCPGTNVKCCPTGCPCPTNDCPVDGICPG